MAFNFPISHYGDNRNIKVGLLGGSFNPAHDGHVYISEKAIKILGLDEVWWLVSPQNPLKKSKNMASQKARIKKARDKITNSKIRVTDIENSFKNNYTFNTIDELYKRFPNVKFVWIMGADNLLQFPKWKKWENIISKIPIAVFDRDNFATKALSGLIAKKFSGKRFSSSLKEKRLVFSKAPCWSYIRIRRHKASSTEIRQFLGECDYLRKVEDEANGK